MKTKEVFIVIALILILAIIPTSLSTTQIEDKVIDLENIETYYKNNTLMIPVREIAELQYYLNVKWIDELNEVRVGQPSYDVIFNIGINEYINEGVAYELSEEPELIEGKTYVPEEFFKFLFLEDVGEKVVK